MASFSRIPQNEIVSQSQKRIMVQQLLSEIYHRYNVEKQFDSSTETSCLSDGLHGPGVDSGLILKKEQNRKMQLSVLQSKDVNELQTIKQELDDRVSVMSSKLVRQLKQRNRLSDKNKRFCDTITAVLQAVSKKRKVDTKLQFNLKPVDNEEGFNQWCDALRAIIRLPGGMPACWRKQVWLCLANHYMKCKHPNSTQTVNKVFSDRICPADESLGNQIVKDLHRTGYSNLAASKENCEEDRLVLKRVLLAYARWNQEVGYCQGFNVLAALILQVTEGNEESAFKIMAHLVDGVLPENYFANNLQGLSVDMAVFRDLMKIRLPQLSRHLDALQKEANKASSGSNYEPPLTNVFTMQWFLTLFATCLPFEIILRIWDSVFLDGSEIVLRIALAIWAKLGERVGETNSADDFYCLMSELMQRALNGDLFNGDELIRLSYKVASFPFPRLKQLREKYTYNITPFAAEQDLKESDFGPDRTDRIGNSGDGVIDDYDESPFFCFSGLVSTVPSPITNQEKKKPPKQNLELANSRSRKTCQVERGNGMMAERMCTDIAALKNQYMSIRSRQLKAHLVYTKPVPVCHSGNGLKGAVPPPKAISPVMVNHLLIGRKEAKLSTSLVTSDQSKVARKYRSHKRSKSPLVNRKEAV